MTGRPTPAPRSASRARAAYWILGPRATAWLCTGFFASLSLATIELVIAVFLQLFLKSLGVLGPDVKVVAVVEGIELTPGGFAVGLAVIAFFRAIAQYLNAQSTNIAMETVTARLRRLAIWEMLRHPEQRFVAASHVNALVAEYFLKTSLFAYSFAALLAVFVQAVALSVILFAGAWRETLVAMTGLFLLGLVITRVNRRAVAVAELVPDELRKLAVGIERVARNFFLVRVLRTQDDEYRRLRHAVDAYESHSLRSAIFGNLPVALTPFVGVLLIIVIVVLGRTVLHTPGLVLLSFLYLFMRFVQLLAAGATHLSTCNQYSPQTRESLRYVQKLSPFLPEALGPAPVAARARRRASERSDARPPGVTATGVAFRYGAGPPVLEGIRFEIAPASQFAIVGPSGCGKSTLLALLLGLLAPASGEIEIDGRSPRAYFDDPSVRVGYVGAEPFLVAGTLRENLLYGAEDDTADDALWAALADARLEDIVRALPEGLAHFIGEDGSGLSAGQKQRLCLARALVRRPHVLVLDELTANLDVDTEAELAETLRDLRGTCTTIVVSHRKGILRYADRVLSLAPP